MRLIILASTFTVLFFAGGACCAQTAACPDAIAVAAAVSEDHLKNWDDLHELFKRYRGCDDGALAEGYSDFVVRTLAHRWDSLAELKKLTVEDKMFEDFVLKHIDASADPDDVVITLSNVKERCPADSQKVCSAMEKALRKTLQDLGALKK